MVDADAEPPRMHLMNLLTLEGFYMQFNPTQIERSVSAEWQAMDVLGLSHQPLQYAKTTNQTVQLELYFRADSIAQREGGDEVMKFLESLMYAPAGATSIGQAAPPRVLVVWPQTLSLTCVVRSVRFRHQRFNVRGQTVEWTASTAFEEIRDVRLTSQQVRNFGSQRAGLRTIDPFEK